MKLLLLFLILLIGCAKSPCIVAVDVAFKNDSTGVSATALKKIKCGVISFPYNPVATKVNEISLIQVNFFQGARVVQADIIFGSYFTNGTFKIEYQFPDTNPDTMVWKVYDVDRSGYVQYSTIIK